jgi:hypothetical protein
MFTRQTELARKMDKVKARWSRDLLLGKLTIFGAVTLLFRNLYPASAENGKTAKSENGLITIPSTPFKL